MRSKFYIFFIIMLFHSCVGNDGEYYSVQTESKSQSFDFTTPTDYSYNAGVLQVTNDSFSLVSNALLFDNFDDNDSSNYNSENLDATTSSFAETDEVMNGDCNAGSAILYHVTNIAASDYNVYHETTPTTFDSTAELSTLVRFTDSDNFYRVSSVNGSHRVYTKVAGTETLLTSVADTDFTLSENTTYATRINVSGTTIEYKIWIPATEPEPETYSVSTTSSDNTTGGFSLICTSAEVEWDNVYQLPANGTNNTAASAPTVIFPTMTSNGTLSYISSIEYTGTVLDEDEILFDISFDGGSTFYTYANYWRENLWAQDGAMNLTELNAQIRKLKPSSNSLIIRVYFNSVDGWANAILTTLTVNYQVLK